MEHWSLRELLGLGQSPAEQRVAEAWFARDPPRAAALARAATDQDPPLDPDELDVWLRMVGVRAAATPEQALSLLRLPTALGRGRRMRGLIEALRANLYFQRWHLRDAIATASGAARKGTGLNPSDLAHLIHDLGTYRYRAGDRNGARESLERAERQFRAQGDLLESLDCQLALGQIWLDAGWTDRVRTMAEDCLASGANLAAPRAQISARVLWAAAAPADAPELLRDAWDGAVAIGDGPLQATVALRRAEMAVRNASEDATSRSEQALRAAERADSLEKRSLALALVAVCRARDGAEGATASLLAEAEAPLKREGIADALARVRLSAARSWLALGKPDRAREEAEWTVFYASEVGDLPLRDEAEAIVNTLGAPEGGEDRDRVRRLAELAVQVELESDPSLALTAIAEAAIELLDADRAFVLLRKDTGGLDVAVSAVAAGAEPGQPSMSIALRSVAREGREILAADLDERAELRGSDSVVALELRSVLCVPLVLRTGVLGAFYVDSRRASEKDLGRAAWVLRALAAHAAAAVRTARQLEESRRRAVRAREFAHDANGALGVVLLVAAELEAMELEAGREALEDLRSTATRLHEMVHGYLTDTRPAQTEVDLGGLVAEVLAPLQRQARQRDITLSLEARPGEVLGSREELGRVVANLVGNAVKYAASRVHVQVSHHGDTLQLAVRDDGPGLPEGAAETVWKRGAQGPGALPGQGLGLAIVRRLVTEMGGTVNAANTAHGAEFVVELPTVS